MTTLTFLVHYKGTTAFRDDPKASWVSVHISFDNTDGPLKPFTIHQTFSWEVSVSVLIKDNTAHPFSFRWLKPLWLFYPNVGKTTWNRTLHSTNPDSLQMRLRPSTVQKQCLAWQSGHSSVGTTYYKKYSSTTPMKGSGWVRKALLNFQQIVDVEEYFL